MVLEKSKLEPMGRSLLINECTTSRSSSAKFFELAESLLVVDVNNGSLQLELESTLDFVRELYTCDWLVF